MQYTYISTTLCIMILKRTNDSFFLEKKLLDMCFYLDFSKTPTFMFCDKSCEQQKKNTHTSHYHTTSFSISIQFLNVVNNIKINLEQNQIE